MLHATPAEKTPARSFELLRAAVVQQPGEETAERAAKRDAWFSEISDGAESFVAGSSGGDLVGSLFRQAVANAASAAAAQPEGLPIVDALSTTPRVVSEHPRERAAFERHIRLAVEMSLIGASASEDLLKEDFAREELGFLKSSRAYLDGGMRQEQWRAVAGRIVVSRATFATVVEYLKKFTALSDVLRGMIGVDNSSSRVISTALVAAALSVLERHEEWYPALVNIDVETGDARMPTADDVFAATDRDGRGYLCFEEFCDWAISKRADQERRKFEGLLSEKNIPGPPSIFADRALPPRNFPERLLVNPIASLLAQIPPPGEWGDDAQPSVTAFLALQQETNKNEPPPASRPAIQFVYERAAINTSTGLQFEEFCDCYELAVHFATKDGLLEGQPSANRSGMRSQILGMHRTRAYFADWPFYTSMVGAVPARLDDFQRILAWIAEYEFIFALLIANPANGERVVQNPNACTKNEFVNSLRALRAEHDGLKHLDREFSAEEFQEFAWQRVDRDGRGVCLIEELADLVIAEISRFETSGAMRAAEERQQQAELASEQAAQRAEAAARRQELVDAPAVEVVAGGEAEVETAMEEGSVVAYNEQEWMQGEEWAVFSAFLL